MTLILGAIRNLISVTETGFDADSQGLYRAVYFANELVR